MCAVINSLYSKLSMTNFRLQVRSSNSSQTHTITMYVVQSLEDKIDFWQYSDTLWQLTLLVGTRNSIVQWIRNPIRCNRFYWRRLLLTSNADVHDMSLQQIYSKHYYMSKYIYNCGCFGWANKKLILFLDFFFFFQRLAFSVLRFASAVSLLCQWQQQVSRQSNAALV